MDLEKIRDLQLEVNGAMEEDDLKWRQQAKEHWLKSRDKNTKNFMRVLHNNNVRIKFLVLLMKMGWSGIHKKR